MNYDVEISILSLCVVFAPLRLQGIFLEYIYTHIYVLKNIHF